MSQKGTVKVEFDVHFSTSRRGRKQAVVGRREPEPEVPAGSLPRVTRLMALAIRFDQLIRDGEIADYAEIARLGHVTRARVTQIMNLLHLAPDIQDAILHLPRVERGRDPISERDLRPVAAVVDWRKQRRAWGRVRGRTTASPLRRHRNRGPQGSPSGGTRPGAGICRPAERWPSDRLPGRPSAYRMGPSPA